MSIIVRIPLVRRLIVKLRGQLVILDRDLAQVYDVTTKRLNEQIKRNKERFPGDFMFQLTEQEKDQVVANCDHLYYLRFSPQRPYAFTRNGANMVSAILKSPRAIKRSIQIMRAFSLIEEIAAKRPKTSSINKQLATHSRAIMRLFQEDKRKGKQIETLNEIQEKTANLFQQLLLASNNSKDE